MKKILAAVLFSLCSQIVLADGYAGIGIGLVEPCRTKYQPSFSGGDCISPNLDVHGFFGREINPYFAIEGSIDAAFSAGSAFDFIVDADNEDNFFFDSDYTSNRWAMANFGVHAFGFLPLSSSVRLFGGPSLAVSIVNFDYDVKYFGNGDSDAHSSTEFGLNYGWAAGIDFGRTQSSFMRLQWQNWRSLDADIGTGSEFNSNALTFNWVGYF
ncbi:hypothetical protein GCM10011613_35280 [Cellvibrio zantedeschiae]|uniref:Outer membrane protein beta-barrel domain-containing protein n=1 Tax=Cellvibrio zantedeschiae TaxID=1237077 RepID=A0ABQ3BAY6_9GAMM|nr:hypothetical protein [Cellvibrio zantedeschiae]GGY87030.1 hypothetical protein GCM10011613_35280 [Cellvibrio zantedeschiae]